MMDERNKFTLRDIKTEFVGDAQRCEQAVEAVINGQVQLVYISVLKACFKTAVTEIC